MRLRYNVAMTLRDFFHTHQTLTLVGIIVVALLAGLGFNLVKMGGGNAPDVPGLLWPDPPSITAFSLDRADGQGFTEVDLDGRWTFLFFGFVSCPDVCPTTLDTMRKIHESLRRGDGNENIQVLFVSVDPERDDPATLKEYVAYFHPEFIAVTADEDRLKLFAKQFGALYMKIATPDDNSYTMDHSAAILLVSPERQFVGIFSQPHDATDIAARFNTIKDFLD